MEHRVHLNLASTAVVLALGAVISIITSTVVAARAYEARGRIAEQQERTITVKGSTRRPIRSNQAVWEIVVRGESAQLQDAYAILEKATHRVREFLVERGFREAEVGLSAIDTETYYARDAKGIETREVTAYGLTRAFVVATNEVDRVLETAGRVSELIQEGIHVMSQAPSYYYNDLASLKIELMGAASADARLRAEEIASRTGCKVREVRSAHMGVLQVTRPFSTQISDYGMYDTATVEKDVSAVVTVTFGVSDS